MKNLIALILGILVLTACGKTIQLPDFETPIGTDRPIDDEPVITNYNCSATTPVFMNITSVSFSIVRNEAGTASTVTCSVTNSSGQTTSNTVNYDIKADSSQSANHYFSLCTVHYVGALTVNIRFQTNGYYNSGQPALNPSDVGWYIANISNLPGSPADGYAYATSTCEESHE